MEEQTELLSSLDEAQSFLQSRMWRDIRREMMSWIDMLHISLEREISTDEIRLIQGRIQGIREVMSLPQRIVEEIQQETRRGENPNGRN